VFILPKLSNLNPNTEQTPNRKTTGKADSVANCLLRRMISATG